MALAGTDKQRITAEHKARLPARWLPICYYAFAHLSLALAFATLAFHPAELGASFYHPRMLAVVHMVTLGWVTCSILGTLYLIAPMTMRASMPANKWDGWACGLVTFGITGIIGHFWIASFSGMTWSAGMMMLGCGRVAWRFCGAISRPPMGQPEGKPKALIFVRLHYFMAFVNLFVTIGMGFLLAMDKSWGFLPGDVLAKVYAHAHLAFLGWPTMMVMATGYRLLPMLLPSAMPKEGHPYASVTALQLGIVGLFICLWLKSSWALCFAIIVALTLASFFRDVRWMLRNRKPAPKQASRPDLATWQALQAMVYLILALVLGLILLATPEAEWKAEAKLAYGILALLGFLSQIIVGISTRLLPLFAWLWSFAEGEYKEKPIPPQRMVSRPLQTVVFVLWTLAVPLMVYAAVSQTHALLRIASGMLLLAVCLGTWMNVGILRHSLPRVGAKSG